jgi:hypothetical protein
MNNVLELISVNKRSADFLPQYLYTITFTKFTSKKPLKNNQKIAGYFLTSRLVERRALHFGTFGNIWENLGPFWNFLGHFETFMNILEHFGTFSNILEHFGKFWNILKHFETFWNILGHFGTFYNILKHFGTFWNILEHFGTFWNILEYFEIFFGLFALNSTHCDLCSMYQIGCTRQIYK